MATQLKTTLPSASSIINLPGLSDGSHLNDSFHFSKDALFWNTQEQESLHSFLGQFGPSTPAPAPIMTEHKTTEVSVGSGISQPPMVGGNPHSPNNGNVSSAQSSVSSVQAQSQSQSQPLSSGIQLSQFTGASNATLASLAAVAQPFTTPSVLPANPAATLPPALASIPAIQNIQAKLLSGQPLNFNSSSELSLTSIGSSKDLIKVDKEPTYVDVTPFLILPQHEAARRLGIPCSTLSKRWKEASLNRKWPYRIVCKLDKEITTLLKNVENITQQGSQPQTVPLSAAVEETLALLLRKRQEELRAVVIRLC